MARAWVQALGSVPFIPNYCWYYNWVLPVRVPENHWSCVIIKAKPLIHTWSCTSLYAEENSHACKNQLHITEDHKSFPDLKAAVAAVIQSTAALYLTLLEGIGHVVGFDLSTSQARGSSLSLYTHFLHACTPTLNQFPLMAALQS